MTKSNLIETAETQFHKMWQLIDGMTEQEPQGTMHQRYSPSDVKNILVHLYEWHQLLIHWVHEQQKGILKPLLPAPYHWKNYQLLNQGFLEKHQTTDCIRAKKLLNESHSTVMGLINNFSNEELFAKNLFSRPGATTLGGYCMSVTSSHYEWAIKKLKVVKFN